MASLEQKPLPDIPSRAAQKPHVINLTVESRAHLLHLVTHWLEEEQINHERDRWADAVRDALDQLGGNMSRGGWLTGFKRTRAIVRKRRQELRKTRELEVLERAKEEEKGKARATVKNAPAGKCKEDLRPERSRSSSERSISEHNSAVALRQLRQLVSTNIAQPSPKPSAKHLLLTTDSHWSLPTAKPEINCEFLHNSFVLPDDDTQDGDTPDCILCGLKEWDVYLYDVANEDCIQIVGGNFRFTGVQTSEQEMSLRKVLRLSMYAYMSLLLEQHFLSNSHVELHFPRPSLPSIMTAAPAPTESPPSPHPRQPKRENTIAAGLWSFLSKKTETLLHRAASVSGGKGSLEPPLARISFSEPGAGAAAEGYAVRQRRFSLISGATPRSPQNTDQSSKQHPFTTAVAQLEACRALLCTSPGVVLPLPNVLVNLAEREKRDPSRRLGGDDKAALASILGWEGKMLLGQGMKGSAGFVRQQNISLLYSAHIPTPLVSSQPLTPSGSAHSTVNTLPAGRPAFCGNRRKWRTYRYYRYDDESDISLGDMISQMSLHVDAPCIDPGCQFKQGDHDTQWIHGGTRIVATVGLPSAAEESPDDESVQMWEACVICGQESRREQMLDGTYMLSFGKYLELLIYSPALCSITPLICDHTTVPRKPWPPEDRPLPRMRFNIHRKFSYKGKTVTFALTPVEDIFELRVPRLQIIRRRIPEKVSDKGDEIPASSPRSSLSSTSQGGDDKRELRREIMRWWQGLSEHIDMLEEQFASDSDSIQRKALPRLPSEDDTYSEANIDTPRAPLSRLPSSTSAVSESTVTAARQDHPAHADGSSSDVRSSAASVISFGSSTHSQDTSLDRLTSLRHAFQREEQTLYAELSRTPTGLLNNVRRLFWASARGASRRLAAWEAKHSVDAPIGSEHQDLPPEPEWWKSSCHAVPGSNVIVREDDWGSIIAFTLSSLDYHRELASMSAPTPRPTMPHPSPAAPVHERTSVFDPRSSFKRLLSNRSVLPDPDQDGVVWQEPETYSTFICRKEHPKDASSLVALRDVLRHKPSSDNMFAPASLKLNVSGTSTLKPHPPSARAKPAVELSTQEADGCLSGLPHETAGQILHDLEAHSGLTGSVRSASSTASSASAFVETNIRRGKTASIISADSDSTVGEEGSSNDHVEPPPPPPKDRELTSESVQSHSSNSIDDASSSAFSIATSFTNTLSSAMRYMMRSGGSPHTVPNGPHHGLLSVESPAIDERPHIKYDWTIGKRLKFSCTVYYAKQFDSLRRRCGIEDVFLRSLARSDNWAAEGGKSKSNFWKTSDDQFIIKTLVNAWNVADLQVLLELGPSYFRYMDSTATKPSVLAKLLGFYTIEIRNLESGATQAKTDLLVMENLFYKQKITKTFDLKGIQGRKVKASNTTSKTLFDGEWIEDQRRTLTLVRPHSKAVFQEAIKADCDFLARSNITDYSLLLGIDEESKCIACGLVDTIGSYTFAKTLEYKAKQGLNSGKEVTVVPPQEYQDRFVSSMTEYFLACPDKWSRPLDDTKIPHDSRDLPSVV